MGRKHPLHIEYIHIGACLGFIQDVVFEAILSHPRLRMEQKVMIVKALGKVLWIQNDLFAKWYVRDGDEYLHDMDEPEFEQEGFLHGKQIVDPAKVSDGEESSGGCPFAGMINDLSMAPKDHPKIVPHVTPHLAPRAPGARAEASTDSKSTVSEPAVPKVAGGKTAA